MNLEKIPSTSRFILENYLIPLSPRSSQESLLLVLLFKISTILCHERVVIRDKGLRIMGTYPNLYGVCFAESGSGKDKAMKTLSALTDNIERSWRKEALEWNKERKDEIEREIEKANMKSQAATEYRKEHAPRWLKPSIDSNSTVEGFLDQRKAYELSGFGYTAWMDSEIYDTIRSTAPAPMALKKAVKEAYDYGDNQDKTIKGNREPKDIKAVPNLMMLHGAIDSEDQGKAFRSFFDLGYARRSFVCMDTTKEGFKRITLEEQLANTTKAQESEGVCSKLIEEIYNKVKRDSKFLGEAGCKVFTLSWEAAAAYHEYEEDCKERAHKVRSSNSSGIVVEISGRAWKMIKLAACIAVQESKDFVIEKTHVEMACYLTDLYGYQFEQFYGLESITIEERMADYIRSNAGCSRTQIRRQKFMPLDQFRQTALLVELLDKGGLADLLGESGEYLIVEAGGRKKNAKTYSIVKELGGEERDQLLAWLRENQATMLTNEDAVARKFGKAAVMMLEEYKVPKREDGAYYLT